MRCASSGNLSTSFFATLSVRCSSVSTSVADTCGATVRGTHGTPYVSARSSCPVPQERTLRRRPVRVACTYRPEAPGVRVSIRGHVAAQLQQTDSQVLLDRLEHGESVGELEHAHGGAGGLRRKSQVHYEWRGGLLRIYLGLRYLSTLSIWDKIDKVDR